MKRKNGQPESKSANPNPASVPESDVVVEIESDEEGNPTQGIKRSWVWTHFKPIANGTEASCQVVLKGGKKCPAVWKKDKSGSTKNFHNHLLQIHHLADPKLLKKTQKSTHMDLLQWVKSGSLVPKVQLNNKSLKNAIVYFLAESNLSFSIVERKSFRELMYLLHKGAMPLMDGVCRSGIATQLARVHIQSQETLKINFLAKKKSFLFTTDAWTAPNVVAFMAVTAHYINEKFEMKELTLAVPHIQGQHTGKMFAELFYEVLEKYDATEKLFTITADNASTNNKMACDLSLQVPNFNTSTDLLGCIAHVINLVAKAGLASLGCVETDNSGEELSTTDMGEVAVISDLQPPANRMGLDFITSTPDGANINAQSIIKKIHGLST
ncbi:hypothetical protein PCANC_12686 [Puccinia coronata f. sp. avenae]|uniref:BED-type domain-containing protein n=1 Tax=Puccinia coronata f. sp. avenae TaxID=200324 RepID=A0A2N5SY76_9BASI|nr:hypothetical protein PCANC_12686 [Puccinia coronata f. sp. avenae]